MERIPKGYIEGAICYLTTRGDHEEKIFIDDKDYLAYMGLLKRYKKQYGFKLFAFTLLPNHLHLLVELSKAATISQITHDINSNYTKHFNTSHGRKGHLFQERPKMAVLEKAAYLLPSMAYIHLNPIKLGLVKDITDYKYSSHILYIKTDKPVDPGVRELGNEMTKEIQETAARYAEYFAKLDPQEMKSLARSLGKEAIMGSQDFKKNVKAEQVKSTVLPEKKNSKKPVLYATIAIIILGALAFYLYTNSIYLRNLFNSELSKKDSELNAKLSAERVRVYRDLDEKYRADMVSYQAMSKRLEIEKTKVKELQKASGK